MDFTNEFLPYMALAVILYGIRQTGYVSNKFIPLVAIVLGVSFSFWETEVSPAALVSGLQYALLGVGTVAGIKYFLESSQDKRR